MLIKSFPVTIFCNDVQITMLGMATVSLYAVRTSTLTSYLFDHKRYGESVNTQAISSKHACPQQERGGNRDEVWVGIPVGINYPVNRPRC